MPSLLTTAVLAFLLALAFTPALLGLLRHLPPPTRRGIASAAPRLGGVAVMAAAALALFLPGWLHWPMLAANTNDLLLRLGPPTLLVLLVGVADDRWNLRPWAKLAGQLVAALWVVAEGFRVNAIFYHNLGPVTSSLLAVLWLLGCSNAFNLIDGLDGLATGLALFATGTVLAHAVLIGEPALAMVMGALFGALAAFLLFNFPPASIYLGDAGSLSIGFLLGCMALAWANKATTAIGLLAPMFALLVPMLDTVVAILRRGLTGQPLFAGDQRHIHHRLLRRGLTPRGAVLVLYGVASLGAAAALLLADVRQRQTFSLVILLFIVLTGIGVHQLRYVEFSSVGSLLRRGSFDPRRSLNAQTALRHWSQEIATAGDWEAVWACLCQAAAALDFHGLEFVPAGASPSVRHRIHRLLPAAPTPQEAAFQGWICRLPLGEHGTVVFWRALDPSHPGFTDELASVLGAAVGQRLEAFSPSTRAAGAGRV
ncbi:MAG TPA: MraY family glycosyltransferase [Terriglobales bacterium]|jgi:UDP-GlcNAc:undecaprenyl-phosphate GlcNAc-1-phosphate transferase